MREDMDIIIPIIGGALLFLGGLAAIIVGSMWFYHSLIA